MFDFWKKLKASARFTIITCALCFFTQGTWNTLLGSILPNLASLCGAGETTSGLMISAQSLGSLIGGFCLGLITRKLGSKRSLVGLLGVGVLFTLMLLVFKNAAGLMLAFLLIGFSRGGITGVTTYTVNHVSGGSASASNLIVSGFAVGAILMPLIVLVCNRWLSWRYGIIAAAGFGLVTLVCCIRMEEDSSAEASEKQTDHSLEFLKDKGFLLLSAVLFFYMCAEYAISGWIVTYIQSKPELIRLFTAKEQLDAYSQTVSTLLWFVILAGRLLCTYLNSKFSTKLIMLVSTVGMAIAFTVLIFSGTLLGVTLSVAVLGFCMSGMYPNLVAESAAYMERFAMAAGVYHAIGSAGAILMPAVVGLVAEFAGFTGGMLIVLAAMILLIFATLLHSKQQKQKITQ